MKYKTPSLLILLCACASSEHAAIEHEIDKQMEYMDLADVGTRKLARKQLFSHKDFRPAVSELIEGMTNVAALDHPEKPFRDFSKGSLKELQLMKSMLDANKPVAELSSQWKNVRNSCNACHEEYE